MMGLNPRGGGHGFRGRGNFYGRGGRANESTGRGDMFTCRPTGMCLPRGPSCAGPQVFRGHSRFIGNLGRPGFGKFGRKNDNRKYFERKNNSQEQEVDLTKPWITEEIKCENKKKEELLETWKKTKNNEDWDKYKSQKLNVQAMHEKAKADYTASHPYEVSLWENVSTVKQHYCETCDRSFKTEDDLLIHEAEHETCYCDGCEFTAHPKIIAKHIKMQHESGLYKRIGNLYTQEDISKWIEERKKRYPTRKVIEDKKILEAEKMKRGERIKDDDSTFNKSFQNKNRGHRKKNFEKQSLKTARKRQIRKKNKTPVLNSHMEDDVIENFRKGVPAFSGIGNKNEPEFSEKNELNISDDEWETECKISEIPKPLLNSSLRLVAEFYNSDEDNPSQEPQNESVMECVSADEGSGPEEVKTFSNKNLLTEDKPNDKKVSLKRKFLGKQEMHNGKRKNTLNQYNFEKQNQTLLEKLLKKEIRRERNIILQCIHYVVNHNFFKV